MIFLLTNLGRSSSATLQFKDHSHTSG